MSAGHADPFHHVRNSQHIELPGFLTDGGLTLPTLHIFGAELPITKYMVLQVIAALLAGFIMRGLAVRVANGQAVHGRFWNFWEAMALYIRDKVVRPAIGVPHDDHHHDDHHPAELAHSLDAGGTTGSPILAGTNGMAMVAVGHPADKYLPFVWSVFFYILFCNLLGAIPFMGSATADLNVTGPLAICVFAAVVMYGIQRSGFLGFWKSLAPSMDLPGPLGYILLPMIWVIEFIGLLIKHIVLAVRLFANMMAGHTVLGVILGFIAQTADSGFLWYGVMPASIVGQIFIGLLELFVAFLQAYVFAFLTSLFIGAAVNPH